jgi:hypothetical protein
VPRRAKQGIVKRSVRTLTAASTALFLAPLSATCTFVVVVSLQVANEYASTHGVAFVKHVIFLIDAVVVVVVVRFFFFCFFFFISLLVFHCLTISISLVSTAPEAELVVARAKVLEACEIFGKQVTLERVAEV